MYKKKIILQVSLVIKLYFVNLWRSLYKDQVNAKLYATSDAFRQPLLTKVLLTCPHDGSPKLLPLKTLFSNIRFAYGTGTSLKQFKKVVVTFIFFVL